ncbi:ABC transporter substrate-binding protein [Microbacterium faecale]|uniref:ABC transporter substrate-binding protein n=1 Tax=Microbacterium faecale TaxID=1804630 RepID=A0A916Y5P7_9MICO|nr:iron ABC transporter permease [Microbacterium faecale]GGD31553.1 ABC transporter substrate-binding protein [Microbacterium faecale]
MNDTDLKRPVPPRQRVDIGHRGFRTPVGRSVHGKWARVAWAATILSVIIAVVYPIFRVVLAGVTQPSTGMFDLSGMLSVLSMPYTWEATYNTVAIGIVATVIALLFAAPMAWGVVRTTLWGRRLFMHLSFLSFLTPGMLIALAYLIPLGPHMPVSQWLTDLFDSPTSLYGFWGLALMTACHEFPIIFISLAVSLSSMSSDLEDAGYAHGLSPSRVVWRITAPLMKPALVSASFLGFVAGINIFGVQAVIAIPARIPLLTTAIYQDFGYPVDFVHAATMAIVLLVISIALTAATNWYVRRSSHPLVVGKAGGHTKLRLATGVNFALTVWSSIAVLLILIIPGSTLILGSLSNTGSYAISLADLDFSAYVALFELGQTVLAIGNSALFALVTTVVVLLLALALVYFERHGFVFGKTMNAISDLAFVIPGIVLAFGLISAYSGGPLVLYNTAAIVVIAYIGRFLPFGRRNVHGSVAEIDRDLELAAYSHSVPGGTTFAKVVFPLTKRAVLAAAIICFFFAFNELSASILLITSDTVVSATVLLSYKEEGLIGQMYALSSVLFVLSILAYTIVIKLAGRRAFADID